MKWVNTWTRDYGVQYSEVIITAMSDQQESIGSIVKNGVMYPQKGNEGNYAPKEDFDRLNEAIKELLNDDEKIEKQIELLKKNGEEYLRISKEISKLDLEKLNNLEILEHYKKFRRIWEVYTSHLWTTFWASVTFSEKAERWLNKKSNGIDKDVFKKLVSYASKPSQEASIMKLNNKLAKLKREYNEEELNKILEEYRWIPCLDLHNNCWDKEHLIEYFNQYQTQENEDFSLEEIEEEFKLNEEELRIVKLNKRLAYVRDLRDEYRRQGIYHIQKLYKEIGKRMGLNLREMSFTRDREIKEFLTLNKIPDKKEINKRPGGFFMYKEKNEWQCITGEEIEKKAKEIGFELQESKEKSIKGKTGAKGKVKGKVKIILTAKDLDKVQEGDVLVALTTGPDYVPAMHKACAFVTDEGGITCHAAIVAREMKKPCIVGTKNATMILNDGDLVEVDADSGIVKKLD